MFLDRIRLSRNKPTSHEPKHRHKEPFWGWWEDLEILQRSRSWLSDETDEEDVPAESPTFDPGGPPLKVLAH